MLSFDCHSRLSGILLKKDAGQAGMTNLIEAFSVKWHKKLKGEGLMANDEIKQKISDYLKSHNVLTLATVTPDGKPLAHTVVYVSEGAAVYFGTYRETRKVQNILKNSAVAYTVDEDYADWNKIQGIQMTGRATILTDGAELGRIMKMYVEKFPAAADMPPDPDMVIIKIEPVSGYFLDYTRSFGYRGEVIF